MGGILQQVLSCSLIFQPNDQCHYSQIAFVTGQMTQIQAKYSASMSKIENKDRNFIADAMGEQRAGKNLGQSTALGR